jgi:rubrerythrin
MELKNLKNHINNLVLLDDTDSPVISCYLNLLQGEGSYRNFLDERKRELRKILTLQELVDFDDAFTEIQTFLKTKFNKSANGAAIFSRAGRNPFFLPLQFRSWLPNWFTIGPFPNIYHLVELKDTYDRFVVLISTQERARILEVNLGEITKQVWMERPELRLRVGREWTKEHYQHHKRERGIKFIKEKIKILEKLMAEEGHIHLILAGNPQITALIRKHLPKHIKEKIVSTVVAYDRDKTSDVVRATLSSFIENEAQKSIETASLLIKQTKTNEMAVTGIENSINALRAGHVDVLVLAQDFSSNPWWYCKSCQLVGKQISNTIICPNCKNEEIKEIDIKEELVRLAEKYNCKIETVEYSDVLMNMEGVGCLLRYIIPEQYEQGYNTGSLG